MCYTCVHKFKPMHIETDLTMLSVQPAFDFCLLAFNKTGVHNTVLPRMLVVFY